MKYLWIVVLLSAGAFGQNAYGPDFLNLHCTAPDPLAQVLFNIQPRPGLVPDHSANGNVVLYCDAAAGAFKASFGGGPYVPLALSNAFDVRNSAYIFDCTGTAAMDTGMQSIPSTAHIVIPFGCIVRLSSAHTYPQTFEFKQGGQLKPDTGVLVTLTGPIIAGSYQIFSNALPTQGGIDFTGNINTFDVVPEWWGANTNATGATNTTALQAAIYGAFGCNVSPATTCRTNAAGTAYYNKRLYLAGKYTIAGELHWYHTLNAIVQGAGRLFSGIIQSAANSRIIDGQSNAYVVFKDLSFSSTINSQDLNHPLVDLNFDNSQGSDLKPQFIDFYDVNWLGSNIAKIGVRIAAAGGGAQGSNVHFYNNFAQQFTEAAYMVGSGSGGVPTNIATNSISVIWQNGDCQTNIAYCIEAFGLGGGKVDGMTFENGGSPSLGLTPQTGYDVFVSNSPSGATFQIENVRSESMFFAGGSIPFVVRNSYILDQAIVLGQGSVLNLGDFVQGTGPGGHGVFYQVTAGGTASGLGTQGVPRTASSGTATTLVDSVGGLTVNAWTGFQVTTLGGTAKNQYCIITSNTATTFTCTAGWLTDFNTVTIANPDNTTTYVVEPNWGSQTTSGTITWATISKTIFGGHTSLDYVFIPGLQVNVGGTGTLRHFETTRADWNSGGVIDGGPNIISNYDGVIVGLPDNGAGTGEGSLGAPNLQRSYKFNRASVTEISQPFQSLLGSKILHWATGIVGGGSSVSDVYAGVTGTVAGQGQFFINNHSSNASKQWFFNFDGSFAFGTSKGQHFNTQAAQSDVSGTCTMSAGTCTAITFTTAYTSAPACTVSWTGSGTLTGILSTAATTTQIKPTSSVGTDTAVVTYICVGNPN